MATKGSRNLNRILRVTATLLFERGERLESIYELLSGFVEPRLIRHWHGKWKQAMGEFPERTINSERLPLPPISWDLINLETLQAVNKAGNSSRDRLIAGN
jgi:hypothetical protein